MRILPRPATIITVLLATVPLFANAADLPDIDAPEVKACVEKVMPEKSLTQTVILRSYDDSGLIEESVASMYWRRAAESKSSAVLRLSAPASRKGLAVLMVESDSLEPTMYLYVPDLKRTRRVTGKQLASSMMGTDFSYEEFSHFQKSAADSETKRLDDRDVDGINAYVLETVPGAQDSAYTRILTYIDQDRCVPLKTQFFNGETIAKELLTTLDKVSDVAGRHVPHEVVMHDREKNTRTELIVENVTIDPELNDTIFSPKRLGFAP